MMIPLEASLSPTASRSLKILSLAGTAAVAAGFLLQPSLTWAALLMAGYLLTGFGLAGIVFVAMQYACGAGWSIAFRRVPEAMSMVLPAGAAVLAIVFILHPSAYPWTTVAPHHGFQAWWLRRPFFLVRAFIYITVWTAFTTAIVRASRRQDDDREVGHTRRNVRLSVVFLVVFAVSFWLASFDWIMSLEPDWASTIFGIYNFAGMFSGGLALMILLVLWLRKSGPLRDFVNEEHLHDLGKLLFAFCTFWMYIWFSQYMLIWYADISEETAYYIVRLKNAWEPLFILNMVLNWAVPFAALLSRGAKRNPRILGRVAALVLAGRILDVYLLIAPPLAGPRPAFGIGLAGALAGAAGILIVSFYRGMRGVSPVPVNDPYLGESLHYHNA